VAEVVKGGKNPGSAVKKGLGKGGRGTSRSHSATFWGREKNGKKKRNNNNGGR